MADSFRNAMINRSLGEIKNNLQFLVESNVLTTAQSDAIISQLPISAENNSRALPAPPTQALSQMNIQSTPTPPPERKTPSAGYYANNNNNNASRNEKTPSAGYYANAPTNAPPPAYPSAPATPMAMGPPALAHASALYQYNAQDAGDLALMPHDKITVTEYMNNEWWKGRNERTGMEGIFPASYVRKEEKGVMPAPYAAPAPAPSNYGNMPLDVAQGAQPPAQQQQGEPSSVEKHGKNIGKKLGNAAIFGAGATIGGNIVNSIF